MSDEEPIDQKTELEEKCKPKCSKQWDEYLACAERIKDLDDEEANCAGQYLEFWECVDHCTAPDMFKNTK